MMQDSTLYYVADLTVRHLLQKRYPSADDLVAALADSYPFADDPRGPAVWLDALLRNAADHVRPTYPTVNVPQISLGGEYGG